MADEVYLGIRSIKGCRYADRVTFKRRRSAVQVLNALRAVIERWGAVDIESYYSLANPADVCYSELTRCYGWKSLPKGLIGGVRIRHCAMGWYIDLPEVDFIGDGIV